jgi:membrane associated rhomboid family serine protease
MQLSINLILVIITVLVSLGGFSSKKVMDDLIFYPPAITRRGQWYRFVSCGLIHADAAHLIFNMLALYLFGDTVEKTFMELFGDGGKWIYLAMYLSALFMSLLPTYLKHRDDYHYRSLGASGAVSAVVFVYIVLYPMSKIGFFILPPIIPGFIFGPLYLLLSAWLDRRGRDNINHSAHIWGALYGLLFLSVACPLAGFPVWQHFIDTIRGGM